MGRDISLTLAGAGADLVLAARSRDTMTAVAEEVRALGRRATCVPADLTDAGECRRLADAAGDVDVLVNNAFAEEDWATFEGFDVTRWRRPFEVNVFGTLALTQAVVRRMKAAGRGGSVVFVSTLSTREPNPIIGGYASSKRAQMTAAQQLALELGPHGIRVNCVAPGHIDGTSLRRYFAWIAEQRAVTPDDVYAEIAGLTALNHIPTSEEISRAVLFLASPLSRAVTGQTLDVNCGRYFH